MITQRKIAEKAGVSYATVSRAFTHSAKVDPDTLQRIRTAMNELGVKNIEDVFADKAFASRMILVVVSDISKEFYANIIIGLSDTLNRMGYSIVLCNSQSEPELEMEKMTLAQEKGYAGIVMLTAVESEKLIAFLQSTRIPVVLVNRYIRSLDLDVVRIDNYRGGYIAASYLAENGHKNISVLAGPRYTATTEDRLRGFRHALADQGIDFDGNKIVYGDLSRECGKMFAENLVKQNDTAAFICNDYMAAGTVQQLLRMGKTVPDDYSILCFDDSPMVNEVGWNLTCLSCSPVKMGQATAEVLLRRIREPFGLCEKLIFSPVLIDRESIRNISDRQHPVFL